MPVNLGWNIVRRRRPLVYSAKLPLPVFAWVQSAGNDTASGTSLAQSFASPVTAGDLIVVMAAIGSPAISATVSDSNSNTYTLDTYSSGGIGIWHCVTPAGSSSLTITVTPNTSTSINLAIAEFSTGGGNVSVGATNSGLGFTSAPSSGNLLIQGADLVVAGSWMATQLANPYTAGSGFTSIFSNTFSNVTFVPAFMGEYQLGVTTSPTPATFTINHNANWYAAGVAYNLVGASVGPMLPYQRVSSPRRLTPGWASTPKALPPHGVDATPLVGIKVVGFHPWRRGSVVPGRILAPTPIPFHGLTVTGQHQNRLGKAGFARSLPQPPPPATPLTSLRVGGQHLFRRGYVGMQALPSATVVVPAVLAARVMRVSSLRRPAVGGRAWLPSLVGPSAAVPAVLLRGAMLVTGLRPGRRGVIYRPLETLGPPPVVARIHGSSLVSRIGEDRVRRRLGAATFTSFHSLFGPLGPVWYHVYSNTGVGDPINYVSAIATVSGGLNYVTSPLKFPATWSFGLRAFWSNDFIEEQNVDAVATLVLDAFGNDITNQPLAPNGLRAFALAGGAVRVEWNYVSAIASRKATGFHVYLVKPPSVLAASTIIRRRRPQKWGMAAGGPSDYGYPVATVSATAVFANSFVANLTGLADGVTYTIGVRAYNATAEEQNTNTVTVTADATGPSAVDSLIAVAIV